MALSADERVESREYTKGRNKDGLSEWQQTRIFVVEGADDTLDADALAAIPEIGDVHPADATMFVISIRGRVLKVGADAASGAVEYTVQYGPAVKIPGDESNQPEDEFSTTGGTEHIERALAQTNYPDPPASDPGVLIGVEDDSVKGVDIVVPKPTLRITRYAAAIDTATLIALTGCVNDDTFEGYAAGEVLFMGATARKRGNSLWQVTYEFAILPNQADIPIVTESGTEHVVKDGWQYLWLRKSRKGASANAKVAYGVESAHVASVYPEGDFSALDI